VKVTIQPTLSDEELVSLFNTLISAVVKEDKKAVIDLFLNNDEKISQSTGALFFVCFYNTVVTEIVKSGLPADPKKALLLGKILAFLSTDNPIDSFKQYLKNYTEFAVNDVLDCFHYVFDLITTRKRKLPEKSQRKLTWQ